MDSEISKLVVVGINHRTSTLSELEKFKISRNEMRQALGWFKSLNEVFGAVIVSTCNRLEFYFVLESNIDAFSIVSDFYCRNEVVNSPINRKHFYRYNGIDAANHLFTVAAGLDSMLLGEYQILGQIKDSYSIACSEKTAERVLHKLFHAAFRVGKNIRTKTKIGACAQSLGGIAVKIIKEKLKKEDAVTIIGVNQNTKFIAERLSRAGFSHLLFVNRTLHKAEELAEKYNGLAFSLDFIEEPIISSKCVFSCTGAPGFIIDAGLINNIYSRINLPRILIDMAVPRDINAEGLNKDIELINLEGLKKYLDEEKKEIESDLTEAEKIISDEVNIFKAWNESRSDDDICLFQEKIEKIRLQLLEETRPGVSEFELELIDRFSHSLTHRIKSIITQAVKTASPESKSKKEAYYSREDS